MPATPLTYPTSYKVFIDLTGDDIAPSEGWHVEASSRRVSQPLVIKFDRDPPRKRRRLANSRQLEDSGLRTPDGDSTRELELEEVRPRHYL